MERMVSVLRTFILAGLNTYIHFVINNKDENFFTNTEKGSLVVLSRMPHIYQVTPPVLFISLIHPTIMIY
jgi:hypothetical protein